MNTQELDEREQRMARFLDTEIGKAFFNYKTAFVRARKAQNDDHYQALQEMMKAEDRLMELTEQ